METITPESLMTLNHVSFLSFSPPTCFCIWQDLYPQRKKRWRPTVSTQGEDILNVVGVNLRTHKKGATCSTLEGDQPPSFFFKGVPIAISNVLFLRVEIFFFSFFFFFYKVTGSFSHVFLPSLKKKRRDAEHIMCVIDSSGKHEEKCSRKAFSL